MSTEDIAIYATLVRGRVYFLGNREFEYDVEQEISQEDHDWLVVHAVDQVTLESEGEHQDRQKFKFDFRPRENKDRPSGEKADTAASSPRPRTR